jgi:uncharacterized Tic20 family protein
MKSFYDTKRDEENEKKNKKLVRKAQWLPFKRFWLLYIALFGTAILSMFAGIYLGLNPDENGYFNVTATNIVFALFYAGGFFVTAEGATLFWETKYVFHDVDKDGKSNNWQVNTALVALVVSVLTVIATGLAAADFLAVWRGNLDTFTNVQEWAQGWVVWSIPALLVFHAVCSIVYWYHSAESELDRWKNQQRRQTQSMMAEVEAQAWADEYKALAPELARKKGAALARQSAMQDFYSEEKRTGKDLDGDGVIGAPKMVMASSVKDETADFTKGQLP